MNFLICTDAEGISGVETLDAVMNTESPDYPHMRERLMADTNAAVSAAFDAGAEKVYVIDGHFHGCNFIKEKLDGRATQITTRDFAWAIKDVQAAAIIGQHAMAGTMNAFLDHTQSSTRIHHYRFNGERIGEIMQVATFCGHFGVPVVALSGDEAACREAERFISGISTASVKTANGRNKAICIPEKEAEERIYAAVKAGIENRAAVKVIKPKLPYTVTIEFNRADYCEEHCADYPAFKRIDVYTAERVVTEINNYYEVM
ncbi:MAG TPA: hypothetical protein DDW54_03365 [Clostridiales bacterium]|nr:hypothetical protein [Clostridiales bacterium]